MNIVQKWFLNAGPLAKTAMAISVTTMIIIGNKYFYAPYAKRQRYLRAEEWANMILEQEEQNENFSSNESY